MVPSPYKWLKYPFILLLTVSVLGNEATSEEENDQASCSSDVVTERGEVVYRCSEISVNEGQSIVLPCVVHRPALACHWFRGVQLLALTKNSTRYKIDGKTLEGDCSLKINNISAVDDDDAWYSCIPLVIHRHPKFDFRIRVRVKPGAPYIIYQNKTLDNGTTVLLTDKDNDTVTVICNSEGGYPAPEIHWLINGELVAATSKLVSYGSRKGLLNITSVIDVQFGLCNKSESRFQKTIQCVLRHPTLGPNDPHWAQVDFQIQRPVSRVYLRSRSTNDVGNILLSQNTSVMLICDADGHPPPSFIFKSRMVNTWREVREETRGAITVRGAGEFKCLAHNELNGNSWIVSNNSVIVTVTGLSFNLPETHLEINGIRFDSFNPVQLQLEKGQTQITVYIQCVSRHVPLAFHNHHLWFVDGSPTEANQMEADVDPDWPNSWRLKSSLKTSLQAHVDGTSVECILNDLNASGSYGSRFRAGIIIHVAK